MLRGNDSAAAVAAHAEQARDAMGASMAAVAAVESIRGVDVDAHAAAAFAVEGALVAISADHMIRSSVLSIDHRAAESPHSQRCRHRHRYCNTKHEH